MGVLEGKVAIVTGAGKGIGKAEAFALAKEGAAVALVARTYEHVVLVAKEIEAFGGRALAVKCDVANRDQVNQAVAATVKAFGTVDILVNNAGVIPAPKSVVEWTEDQMRASWETGLLGSWFFMVACFPYLKNRDGRIINTCSAAGHGAIPGLLGYSATKEAIRSITRTAAREWGQYNVHVNAIAPAVKTSGVSDSVDAEGEKMYLAMIPLNRWGDAEKDIGRVVVFLAGPDSSFMTGNTISVDGGAAMVV
jgi:NAD(P)-dependent dehydrogenase (short-subunit alcohol dehydrogenase family)